LKLLFYKGGFSSYGTGLLIVGQVFSGPHVYVIANNSVACISGNPTSEVTITVNGYNFSVGGNIECCWFFKSF